MVNHIGIYGSKAAEGLSAFQRRSCISFEVQRGLSKLYSIHNKIQSWHLTNDHSRMVEIIGIQNYAFTQCLGHQLNILWQNAISDLYIFDHPRVNIFLGSILECFIPQSKVDHSEIWSFVKCGFLTSSCISQFANMAIMCKLQIEDMISDLKKARVDCWQYMPLNVAHDLMVIILISDGQFIWR